MRIFTGAAHKSTVHAVHDYTDATRSWISAAVLSVALTWTPMTNHDLLTLRVPTAARGLLPAPALAADDPTVGLPSIASSKGMSEQEIERYFDSIPVLCIVNDEDQPFFTSTEGRGLRVGYFYLEPLDAIRELKLLQQSQPDARLKVTSLSQVYFSIVQKESKENGGALRVRPARRQVVEANRALQFNSPEGALLPVSLDENKGQVPVFYSEKVVFEINGVDRYPFFFRKDDLDAAYLRSIPSSSSSSSSSSYPSSSSSSATADDVIVQPSRAEGGRRSRAKSSSAGLPVGLVRVATLDGVVRQMKSGEIDLRNAIFVPSTEALEQSKQLSASG